MSADFSKIEPPQTMKDRITADRKELNSRLASAKGEEKLMLELWDIELDITEERVKGTDRSRDKIRKLQELHHEKTKQIARGDTQQIIKRDEKEAKEKPPIPLD